MELLILADRPEAHQRLCGVSPVERILRIADRLGIGEATVLASCGDPDALRAMTAPSPARPGLIVRLVPTTEAPVTVAALRQQLAPRPPDSLVMVVPGDGVYDARLLEELVRSTAPVALVDSCPPVQPPGLTDQLTPTSCGVVIGPAVLLASLPGLRPNGYRDSLAMVVDTGQLAVIDVAALDPYLASLRRELRPIWMPAPRPGSRRAVEAILIGSARKGTLDLPALVHAPIEDGLIRLLCRTPITPTQLTVLTNLVAWLATILFAGGRLGAGLGLALGVGILDGLDGKQARVKIETTEAGRWEHGADWLYETSWWLALAGHFAGTGVLPGAWGWTALLVAADLGARMVRRVVKQRRGRDLDTLAPADRAIRLVGGRRNIYVWLLALGWVAGWPADALVLAALWAAATTAALAGRAWWHLRPKSPTRVTPA